MIIKYIVGVMVFNNNGELALQLRAAHDASYPGHWDFSAAGGINEGEAHEEAAVRELREEIGITTSLTFVGEELCEYADKKKYLYLYKANYNGAFIPDANEVADVQFFSFAKIQDMIDTGTPFHPEFVQLWKKGIIHDAAIH